MNSSASSSNPGSNCYFLLNLFKILKQSTYFYLIHVTLFCHCLLYLNTLFFTNKCQLCLLQRPGSDACISGDSLYLYILYIVSSRRTPSSSKANLIYLFKQETKNCAIGPTIMYEYTLSHTAQAQIVNQIVRTLTVFPRTFPVSQKPPESLESRLYRNRWKVPTMQQATSLSTRSKASPSLP